MSDYKGADVVGTVAVELICGKCNCLMKSYQHNTTSYVSFHCNNCDITVNSPNLSEYLKKENKNEGNKVS